MRRCLLYRPRRSVQGSLEKSERISQVQTRTPKRSDAILEAFVLSSGQCSLFNAGPAQNANQTSGPVGAQLFAYAGLY